MRVYIFTLGNARAELHHDGSVDLSMSYDGLHPLRVSPEDLEDMASMLALTAARSERMRHDIGSFPERCPFRKGDGLAFGARCVLGLHGNTEHVF